jgi:hypothetical protein
LPEAPAWCAQPKEYAADSYIIDLL